MKGEFKPKSKVQTDLYSKSLSLYLDTLMNDYNTCLLITTLFLFWSLADI